MNRIMLDTIPELLCPLGEEVPDPWKSPPPTPTPTPETLEKPCSSQGQVTRFRYSCPEAVAGDPVYLCYLTKEVPTRSLFNSPLIPRF